MPNTEPDLPLALHWARRSVSEQPRCDPAADEYSSGHSTNGIAHVTSAVHPTSGLTERRAVLIVTRRFDPHADAVASALDDIGFDHVRINSEDLLSRVVLTWRSIGDGLDQLSLSASGKTNLSVPGNLLSGYFRNPANVAHHQSLRALSAQKYSSHEGDTFLDSLYFNPELRWVSPPDVLRRAEAKLPQLQLAAKLGLRTPRTIVTNSPEKAYSFAKTCNFDVLVKPLDTPEVDDRDDIWEVYAHRLDRNDLDAHIDSVRFAPTVLQEYVPKATEIRVTIIGAQLFAVELDSQSVPAAVIDWRKVNPFTIKHRAISLPIELDRRLRTFVAHYNLEFGAIDLIRRIDGEFFFLENNPNGQWLWLEVITGEPLSKAMAKLLTRH